MKNSLSKRLLAILLVIVLTFSVLPMVTAAGITYDGTTKLYVDLNGCTGSEWWINDMLDGGCLSRAYFFGDSGYKWADMSRVEETTVFSCPVPAGSWSHVILCRCKPGTEQDWGSDGSIVYNQTGDIPLVEGKNFITSFVGVDSAEAQWDVYDDGTSTVEGDFYLVGYFDGADYYGEDYHFENGKLTTTFADTGYVYVKTGENVNYMTNGWQGEVKSVILYNEAEIPEMNRNKLVVPGNKEITFTLTAGEEEDTLVLSYTVEGEDPTPTTPVDGDYYLVGYFDGADYYANDYKFVDGKLTATFAQDSYAYIKTAENVNYMTNGWQGFVNTATLYNEAEIPEADRNKLYVPGNKEVEFTLTVNDNDTMTLSYIASEDPFVPGDHSGADDKVILHCWNWSYDEIRENLPAIKAAGFTAVQTSPAQVPKGYHAEGRDDQVSGNWWALYQPVSFCIAPTADDSYLGGKAELEALCTAAHEEGIEVVVDIVSNHVGNGWNDIHDAGGNPEQPVGDGGKLFWITPSGEVANYGLDWLLEKDGSGYKYFRDYIKCTDNSTEGTVRGCIELPDLKTETAQVQNMVANYLIELIDVGVDGFRFDAAKHIETPTDGDFASDYWPNILGAAQTHFEEKRGEDAKLWAYGEILYQAAYTRNMSQYTPYLDVTDINYAGGLIYGFGEGQGANNIASLEIRDWNGKDKEPIPAKSAVLFAETHDMYSDSQYSTSKFSVQDVNKSWAVATARADVSALYFARPAGYADHAPYGTMGRMESTDWMDAEVAEANKFHTAFIGAEEYVHADGDYVLVERWNETDSGLVIVNAVGTTSEVNVRASYITDGEYYDQITGEAFTVSGGTVSGSMGNTGIAILRSEAPVDCDHPEDQRYTRTVEPTCTESGYEAIYCRQCGRMVEMVSEYPALGHIDENGDKHCDRCGEFLGLITVYFVDTNDWIPAGNYFDNVRYHAWSSSGASTAWPGVDMEIVGRTKDDHGIWMAELNPEKYTSLLFNAGAGGERQTVDLKYVEDAAGGSTVVYTADYEPGGRTFDGSEELYINAAAVEWWRNDGAVLLMTLKKADGSIDCLELSQKEGSVYGAVIPAGSYVSLVLSRQDPADENNIWNSTGDITIPPQGNYVESFSDGSAAAVWGFWPSGEYDKIGAAPGAVLNEICGHVGYRVIDNGDLVFSVCDCCGEVFDAAYNGAFLFDDVKDPDAYFYLPVYWAYTHDPQITDGISDTLFGTDGDCTRAQVVTFLWRAAGEPQPTATSHPFVDVEAGSWYEKPVLWAVEQGITDGTGDTTFSPTMTCTRAQVVTFLWRASGKPVPGASVNRFTDVPGDAWYYSPVLWAVEKGVTDGTSDTTFSPDANCKRSQVVTFLFRALKDQ